MKSKSHHENESIEPVGQNAQLKKSDSSPSVSIEDKRPQSEALKQLKSSLSSGTVQLSAGNDAGSGGGGSSSGLPSQLKSGVESLSGQSMDDVKVHYNSDKPAQLNAHAYAQGSDIHLGPGQEKHLPHEAWHVVQQKQGRVEPTTQMRSKVPINDDPGLEKEADVMGAKAASLQLKDDSIDRPSKSLSSGIAQLKDGPGVMVETFDKTQEDREKDFDPLAEEYQDKLDAHKQAGEDMGEGAKVKFEGELTFSARFNRWRGNESTYSQILRKAEDFNKATDVVLKQSILMELKPLARSWLEKHALPEGGKADENELKKQKSIYEFLNQTTSNYPQIIQYYDALAKDLNDFRSNPINNRTRFASAVEKFKQVNSLKKLYKSKYPPALNMMYVSEMQEFAERDEALIKEDSLDIGKFDTKLGFSAEELKAGYNLGTGNLFFRGRLSLNYADLTQCDGVVEILFDSEGGFEDIIVSKASASAKIGEVKVVLSNMTYQYAKNTFMAKKGTGKFNLLGTNLDLTLHDASYSNGEFDFDKLVGTADEVDTGLGVKLKNAEVVYKRGHVILLLGKLDFDYENVSGDLNGKFTLDTTDEHKIRKVEISEGNLDANALGVKFTVSNISYNSSTEKLKADEATGSTHLLGHEVSVSAQQISYSGEEGFDVQKATGTVRGEFGGDSGVKIKDPSVTFIKSHVILIQSQASLKAFGIDASGDVTFAFDTTESHKLVNVKIKDGKLETSIKGFDFNLEGLKYSLQKKQVKAKKAEAKGTILETPVTLVGDNVSYGPKGFDFTRIAATTGGKEISAMKVFTLKPEEFALLKNGEEYKAEAKGEVGLNLPSFLDIEAKGKIKGLVGVNLDKLTEPYYHIDSASAKIEATNPLSELASYLGGGSGRYELSAGIPVFPGISAVFGLFIAYGVDFGKKLVGEVSYEDGLMTIYVGMDDFKAMVEAGVFGGVQAGSEFLLALALLLVASGIIEVKGNVGYRKSFPVGEDAKLDGFKKGDDGITYKLAGAVKLKASLDIVATALYFFQKRFSITLGEATLGSVEIEKGKDVKWNKKSDSDSLSDKDALEKKVDSDKKAEAKRMSLEQLLSLDQNYRFSSSEKKDAIKTVESAEQARAALHEEKKTDENGQVQFNEVAMTNVQMFDKFVTKRVNWTDFLSTIDVVQELTVPFPAETPGYVDMVLSMLETMGEDINLASDFITHYDGLVAKVWSTYNGQYGSGELTFYYRHLLCRAFVLKQMNIFKGEFLHSGFWGDAEKQRGAVKTSSWFGKSNYEVLAEKYKILRGYINMYRASLPPLKFLEDAGEKANQTMMLQHQKKLEEEAKRASSSR
jgi:hypothetical protein